MCARGGPELVVQVLVMVVLADLFRQGKNTDLARSLYGESLKNWPRDQGGGIPNTESGDTEN